MGISVSFCPSLSHNALILTSTHRDCRSVPVMRLFPHHLANLDPCAGGELAPGLLIEADRGVHRELRAGTFGCEAGNT